MIYEIVLDAFVQLETEVHANMISLDKFLVIVIVTRLENKLHKTIF